MKKIFIFFFCLGEGCLLFCNQCRHWESWRRKRPQPPPPPWWAVAGSWWASTVECWRPALRRAHRWWTSRVKTVGRLDVNCYPDPTTTANTKNKKTNTQITLGWENKSIDFFAKKLPSFNERENERKKMVTWVWRWNMRIKRWWRQPTNLKKKKKGGIFE